jgi:hypothetical protein
MANNRATATAPCLLSMQDRRVAMKTAALFALVFLSPIAGQTSAARTIMSSQGNADENSVAGAAGPDVAANGPPRTLTSPLASPDQAWPGKASSYELAEKPEKKLDKKAPDKDRVTLPPAMHDQN